MNQRNAEKVLNHNFRDWAKSLPVGLQNLAIENTIISGGAIASLLMGECVHDFDLYFRDMTTALEIANYYATNPSTHLKPIGCDIEVYPDGAHVGISISGGHLGMSQVEESQTEDDGEGDPAIEILERGDYLKDTEDPSRGKYLVRFFTTNSITLTGKIQLVMRFCGNVPDIHNSYDFAHCMCAWSARDRQLHVPPHAMEAMLSKELRYNGSLFPLCSVIRMRKFIRRGWRINAGQILKMLLQVSELDLTDGTVLREQLIGVDTAYFRTLLDRLEKEQIEGGNAFNQDHIVSVIDHVFG